MEAWEKFTQQGKRFEEQGDYNQAFASFYRALDSDASRLEGWVNFAKSLRFLEVSQPNGRLKNTMIECLSKPISNHQDVAFAGMSLLKLLPDVQKLLHTTDLQSELWTGKLLYTLSDPLLLGLMEKTILADAAIERLLTRVRHLLLKNAHAIDPVQVLPFLSALAKQCFLNEYVYAISQEEEILLKDITSPELLACYYGKEPSSSISDIPKWGSIQDDISKKVQAQYEEHPYPRWTSLNPVESTTLTAFLNHRFSHKHFPNVNSPKILIAGCGTGQHAFNTARQFKECHVIALDLSRTSLDYAKRKAQQWGIHNADFLQADILTLSDWPERFDLIECSGVLHHMADPEEGWRILTQLLKPHGIMNIGLYSERGRQDIVAARRLIAAQGFISTLDGIRRCRQYLLQLHDEDPAKEVTRSIDFYTTSTCRDLLFHVQEHRFTLPQIEQILHRLHLEFLGFDLRDPLLKKEYATLYSDDAFMLSLENWDQFEQRYPQTFAGMYQFWVQR